jgi:hypothetical protein
MINELRAKLNALSPNRQALIFFGLLMLASALYGWYSRPTLLPTQQFTTMAPSALVKGVSTSTVSVPKLKTFSKTELAKKVNIPLEVMSSASKNVTAVVELPPSRGGTEVVSVVDSVTGETSILAKEKPLPLFGFENQKRIGVGVGFATGRDVKNVQEVKVFAEWTFVRVGGAYGSVQAEVNTNSEAKAFVALDYRF